MSLLTQFYPSSSGGAVATSSNVGFGPGSMTLVGSNPTGGYPGKGVVTSGYPKLMPPYTTLGTAAPTWVAQIAGTAGSDILTLSLAAVECSGATLSNLVISNFTFPSSAYSQTNFTYLTLNGASLMSAVDGSSPFTYGSFTGIYGSGSIMGIAMGSGNGGGSSYPLFTYISPDITFPAWQTVNFRNAALDAPSVNHVLTSMVATRSDVPMVNYGKSVDMSGGTSAGTSSLTAEGLAARDALVAAGWTVTLNA